MSGLQLQFVLVYRKLGRYPFDISIKIRMLCFCSRYISSKRLS